jgi:hypothetical protein
MKIAHRTACIFDVAVENRKCLSADIEDYNDPEHDLSMNLTRTKKAFGLFLLHGEIYMQ